MRLGNIEEARRARGGFFRNGSGWLSVALVVVAMLHAVLVPTLLRRVSDRLRSEIQDIIEPARRLTRTRQASLAVEVSAYRAYVISREARLLERVREARANAEAAVRARDEVVSIVSHDLRNPLSTVTMAASFLLETSPPGGEWATARQQLEMIKRGSDRMNRMIQDLLDIARIESGGLTIERAQIAVQPLMDEVAAMARPAAEKHGQRLEYRVANGLPAIAADRDRLFQVFSNLVDNAVKFTPRAGTLVEAHGGDIAVKSAPGHGTAFQFSIPTALPSARGCRLRKSEAVDAAEGPLEGRAALGAG
jgi:signal transduction histidine kinase